MNERPDEYVSPPHNIEAEQFLLGALMTDNAAFDQIADFMKGEFFYEGIHRFMYGVIAGKISKGEIADPVTLWNSFGAVLEEIGGASYLREIAASVPNLQHVSAYAHAIINAHQRRKLIELGRELVTIGYDAEDADDIKTHVEAAQTALEEIQQGGKRTTLLSLYDAMAQAVEHTEEAYKLGGQVLGISTGMPLIDQAIGGLAPGRLVVLGARPKIGKTSLAAQWGLTAARDARAAGKEGKVLMFSLEMRGRAIAYRMLAHATKFDIGELMHGKINSYMYDKMADVRDEHRDVPFFIDETARNSFAAITASIRAQARRGTILLVIIDYLQKIKTERVKGESRTDELGRITGTLQEMALANNLPVLLLSQLNRDNEKGEGRRPQLSDLRGSGDIEQDADQVILLHREIRKAGPTVAILAANRWGQEGEVVLNFHGPTTTFSEAPPDVAEQVQSRLTFEDQSSV